MSKLYLSIAAACLAGLASCFPPPPEPPHRFRPRPQFAPEPDPDSYHTEVPPPSDQPQPAPVPPPTATGGYPTARPTENPEQVISPYDPFNVIDVAGFKSGQLVRDPSNQKIFRVP